MILGRLWDGLEPKGEEKVTVDGKKNFKLKLIPQGAEIVQLVLYEGRLFMFYYFAECGDKSIVVKREATEEEAIKVQTFIKPISRMLVDKERINSFNSKRSTMSTDKNYSWLHM